MRFGAYSLTALGALLSSSPAFADGGYYAGSKGARAAGRAGAFTVKADDVMASAYNPAGLARIERGLVQIGNRFSYNAASFERAATLDWGNPRAGVPPYVEFAKVENEAPWQLLEPLLGVTSNLGLDDFGFGLTVYAPPGIGKQRFPVSGGQRYMMVSREAQIIDYSGSVAWRYGDVFGLGASLEWLYLGKLDYQLVLDGRVMRGANPVSSNFDILSTVSGSDPFAFNARLGAWYRPLAFLEFGISGQIVPTSFETQSSLSVEGFSPDFEELELTRDGDVANDVSVELPLPLSARAGVRYIHLAGERELFDVELDVVYETWSRVERFTVETNGLVATWRDNILDVGTIHIDKQWNDTLGVHLGGDYHIVPALLTGRAGVFYESAVADRAYSHVDFAGGRQLGGALGASVLVDAFELAVGYEYRHQPAVTVSEGDARVYQEVPGSPCEPPYTDDTYCHEEYIGVPAPVANAGTYRAHSHLLSLDVLYRF